jgi:hypothetical protein
MKKVDKTMFLSNSLVKDSAEVASLKDEWATSMDSKLRQLFKN